MKTYTKLGCLLAVGILFSGGSSQSQNPQGAEFQVNSYTTHIQDRPAVATGSSFVVVWGSYGSAALDSSQNSIQGQRFGGPVPVELLRFSVG